MLGFLIISFFALIIMPIVGVVYILVTSIEHKGIAQPIRRRDHIIFGVLSGIAVGMLVSHVWYNMFLRTSDVTGWTAASFLFYGPIIILLSSTGGVVGGAIGPRPWIALLLALIGSLVGAVFGCYAFF